MQLRAFIHLACESAQRADQLKQLGTLFMRRSIF